MFSQDDKKKLIDHFKTPLRHRQLSQHAQDIIGDTSFNTVSNFIRKLQTEGIIHSYELKAKNDKTVTLYASCSLDEVSPYDLGQAMFPDGYFCDLSSIYYHSLTNQIPKTIYICHETISASRKGKADVLNNTILRSAFIKPHRYTNYVFEHNNYEIVVIDRKKNSGYGVTKVTAQNAICPSSSRVTSIERALIDAIVSPQYNGGIVSVYTYFKHARQKLNIHKLVDIYRQLDFVYPYSQSIGFFLDKLGIQKQASLIHNEFPPKHKFYIDHIAKASWKFDEKWNLYYPNGLVDEN